MLDQCIVVLHQPQEIRNIGAVVRAMKNMGFTRLRLVEPPPFDPADIRGIAHRSEDLLAAMEIFTDLDATLADCRYVLGMSERAHSGRACYTDPRALAPQLLAHAAAGPLALLFGPEDNGLNKAALDRCHALLALPTDPAYPSLNLAQAALLLLYELRLAALSPPPQPQPPPTATMGELAVALTAIEQAVASIGFIKSGNPEPTIRSLRSLFLRAAPDSRETALVAALAREVVYALERRR